MKYKYVLINLRICPHLCLDKNIEDNFEFGINWQKPYIINVKYQKCVHPDLKRSGDIFYNRPCTDVNADGVLKLQHYQDTTYHTVQNWL